ncbi:MAG: hypothetical protein E6G85_29890 [Alphaproteobacteria bacterium]|nr:MAG: hypothetical protein E6G85_29890 [Alphaproteobacteria bacterium]
MSIEFDSGPAQNCAGRRRVWFKGPHAFWLLPDDCSARSDGPAGCLRALSVGYFRSVTLWSSCGIVHLALVGFSLRSQPGDTRALVKADRQVRTAGDHRPAN